MFSKGIKRKAAGHKEIFAKRPFLPDLWVMLKILSSEYQLYAPQGHFLRGTWDKIFRML
jgi:hypothetical protein